MFGVRDEDLATSLRDPLEETIIHDFYGIMTVVDIATALLVVCLLPLPAVKSESS